MKKLLLLASTASVLTFGTLAQAGHINSLTDALDGSNAEITSIMASASGNFLNVAVQTDDVDGSVDIEGSGTTTIVTGSTAGPGVNETTSTSNSAHAHDLGGVGNIDAQAFGASNSGVVALGGFSSASSNGAASNAEFGAYDGTFALNAALSSDDVDADVEIEGNGIGGGADTTIATTAVGAVNTGVISAGLSDAAAAVVHAP